MSVAASQRPEQTRVATARAARRPRTILVVALVALAHGLFWSILIPPFQAPDETEHLAYVQYVAETGKLPPKLGNKQYSSEELMVFDAIGTIGITGKYLGKPPATQGVDEAADRVLRRSETRSRSDGGGASGASSQPPLAYLMWAVPYKLASHGSLLTRLWLMRLLSAACFVATAIGAALLARELLPSWRWAGPIAGLLVALQPTVAFIAVSVNPDTLVFALSTFALLAATRILRHGLTARRALTLGLLTGAGIVTKLTFLGLVPGLGLALLIGLWRARGARVRLGAIAVGTAAVLPVLYAVWATAQGRGLLPPGGGTVVLPADEQEASSLTGLISYGWQLYLPRLPFMHDFFTSTFPPYHTWVQGYIGRLGWLDYALRGWIYPVGAALLSATAVLAAVALARFGRVRRHWRELAVYALCVLGLAAQIAAAGYGYRNTTGFAFEQARYLYPFVALFAVALVSASTAFGRRVAPALAATYVGVATLHVLAVVFATVARYYG